MLGGWHWNKSDEDTDRLRGGTHRSTLSDAIIWRRAVITPSWAPIWYRGASLQRRKNRHGKIAARTLRIWSSPAFWMLGSALKVVAKRSASGCRSISSMWLEERTAWKKGTRCADKKTADTWWTRVSRSDHIRSVLSSLNNYWYTIQPVQVLWFGVWGEKRKKSRGVQQVSPRSKQNVHKKSKHDANLRFAPTHRAVKAVPKGTNQPTYENMTFSMASTWVLSSQNAAGLASRRKNNGMIGKKNPRTIPLTTIICDED